jgi:hypothetical protein
MRTSLFFIAALCLASSPALVSAAEAPKPAASEGPKSLGTTKSWGAYSAGSGKNIVCYMVGKPTKTLPVNPTRGRVDAHVTHRPGENADNVVNFGLGYETKANSKAELDIDGKKFALFTNKDSAWAADAATDKNITIALGRGKVAILKATSARGTNSTDTYSLDGFGAALELIDKTCKVKR